MRQTIIGAALLSTCAAAHAQSGAEARDWAAWCKRQGGQVQVTSSNPVCIPPAGGTSSGYTQAQQQMLDLAGQFGSALGASIRGGLEAEARAAEIRRMQRSWETEQARLNAVTQVDVQKQRSAALLASMQGTIGGSELGTARTPTGSLQPKTGEEALRAPATVQGSAVEPDRSPAVRQAWDDYLKALQRKHAAEKALAEKESERELALKLTAEAARQGRLVDEAAAMDAKTREELHTARTEAIAAARALTAAEKRRDRVGE